ncbi:MAG: PASTA domain-containing protein [Dehalobacter sp.]|nr:PASTA domain-containing protein [Dehalobacter sp.]
MSKENNPNCTIKHMVLLKWKPGTTEEQAKAFGEWIRELADDIGFVFDLEHGPSLEPRYHSAYFDYCIMLSLGGGYEAMSAYMSHWSHLRADARMASVCGIIEQVMAFNFEVNPYGRTEYDPVLAREDIERERERVQRVHPNKDMAYVPDLRGRFVEDAIPMLEAAGITLDSERMILMGSSWAPGRINATEPEAQKEVPKGTKVKLTVSGDYLMGVDVPYVIGDRPLSPVKY